MNVIWLTSSYPLNEKDTTSIFLKYLAEGVANKNVQLRIVAPDHEAVEPIKHSNITKVTFKYFLPRKLQKLAYGSGILPNLKQNIYLFTQIPSFLISMMSKLISECRKSKPDLIHAHWIFPVGTIAVLVGKLLQIPVIITAHGGDAFSLNNIFFQWLKRWTIRNSYLCTSNTRATEKAITTNTNSNLINHEIVPMGVDFNHFNSGKQNAYDSLKSSNTVLLFVGRLIEKKGVMYLIDAYHSLIKSGYSNLSLWVVGDGEQKDALNQKVEDYGLNSVHFFGKVGHQQLSDIYASSDIFVAPSIVDNKGDTEGQGVVFLEAMASGKPVIATDVGGITDVLTHEDNALICEQKNIKSLVAQIKRLLSDTTLRDRLSKSSLATSRLYDWNAISDRFYGSYLASIKNRPEA